MFRNVRFLILHFFVMLGIAALVLLIIAYPFLPGSYDRLAVPVSTMAQSLGGVGLLLAPIGIWWIGYELRMRGAPDRPLSVRRGRLRFVVVTVVVSTLVAVVAAVVALATVGPSLCVMTSMLWVYVLSVMIRQLKRRDAGVWDRMTPVPVYLAVVPVIVFLSQLLMAGPLTELSRNRAIAHSEEFIGDIESYRSEHGHYPVSLLAMWKDYDPGVAGIEKFHFAPSGAGYNLFFEQPRFLFDNIGTREWVVYNPRDEHTAYSHTAWMLLLSPSELPRSQGWYAVHDGPAPHWKYFWFD